MKPFHIPIRVVFYWDEGRMYAHSLEFGVIGDGDDQRSALDSLMEAIAVQVQTVAEHGNPSNLFTPAEPRIFEMFASGHDVFTGELEIGERRFWEVTIESVLLRQYEPADQQASPVESA